MASATQSPVSEKDPVLEEITEAPTEEGRFIGSARGVSINQCKFKGRNYYRGEFSKHKVVRYTSEKVGEGDTLVRFYR